jgi:hypothetical protein
MAIPIHAAVKTWIPSIRNGASRLLIILLAKATAALDPFAFATITANSSPVPTAN